MKIRVTYATLPGYMDASTVLTEEVECDSFVIDDRDRLWLKHHGADTVYRHWSKFQQIEETGVEGDVVVRGKHGSTPSGLGLLYVLLDHQGDHSSRVRYYDVVAVTFSGQEANAWITSKRGATYRAFVPTPDGWVPADDWSFERPGWVPADGRTIPRPERFGG